MNLHCHENLKSCNMNHPSTVITFLQASCVKSLSFTLLSCQIQKCGIHRQFDTHIPCDLFAPHNLTSVKSNDSNAGLHSNVQRKSTQMNGATDILEVLTSTEVRKHQVPVCGPKMFTVLFLTFQMIKLHQMHECNRSLIYFLKFFAFL
jgi:hypothetical protein